MTTTTRMKAALGRRLAGLALAGLVAGAAVPAAAQWLPPWRAVASTSEIAERLEAQGYLLVAPLQRRPGVYLADVRAGPGGVQRLVIDDRSGEILERFLSPPRRPGPEFAVRYDEAAPPPPGVFRLSPGPTIPAPRQNSAYGGAADVRIPNAISPYGPQSAPASTTKPRPGAAARKTPGSRTTPGIPPAATPPLPPPAPPREARDPNEAAPPAPNPEPKIESSPGQTDNASAGSASGTPEAAWVDRPPEGPEQSANSPADMTANTAPAPSADEASGKAKVSIVPAAVFE